MSLGIFQDHRDRIKRSVIFGLTVGSETKSIKVSLSLFRNWISCRNSTSFFNDQDVSLKNMSHIEAKLQRSR